ncbi:amino acid adenylation domain-containing protein [Salibacterium sp. K-3]
MGIDKKIEMLEKLKKQKGLKETKGIPRRESENDFPLSFAQERLWFINELAPDSAAYNIPLAMRIKGRLDVEKLTAAFNGVIKKHEILRASFRKENGRPVQVILPYVPVDIPVVPIRAESTIEQESIQQQVNQAACKQIPWNGMLFHITLFKVTDDDHILLLVLNHIIFDGWSTGILMKEIADMYQHGVEVNEKLSIQYADYAKWQKDKYEQGDFDKHIQFFKKKLGQNIDSLQLPYDFKVAKKQLYKGDIERFALCESTVENIKSLSKEKSVSPFAIMLSAYYLFLYKYSGQKQLVLGVPVSNRDHLDVEPLIGCFANTVPLKTVIHPETSIDKFIELVHQETIATLNYQDFPFDKLVDELNIERNLSENPVFQSMFVYQREHHPNLQLGECSLEPYKVKTETSKVHLSLSIMEGAYSIEGFIEYSNLFKPATAKRMVQNFIHLLEETVQETDKLVSQVKGISKEEEQVLISQEVQTYDKSATIHEIFENRAKEFPHKAAVIAKEERITYSELDKASNRLSRYLLKQGVKTETKVAVSLDRSIGFIISILAILKAGGTYIPLDPEQPENRRKYILKDSGCKYLLTDHNYLLEDSYTIIHYNGENWRNEKSDGLHLSVYPDQVAYIIYTSGSTGSPKGVLNTHHNVKRLFESASKHMRFTEDDKWTLFHSTAFDFSVWELWGALFHGGAVYIISTELKRKPNEFFQFLSKEKITVLNQTPSAFKEISRVLDGYKTLTHDLKYIIFGGEALQFSDLQPWFKHYGDKTKLINMYGITETTVHVTCKEIKEEDLKNNGSLIGRPLDDLQVYILDENYQPVPIGVPGEIYVEGAGIALGYHDRFSLTAEKMVPSPFSDTGARLYKTGDIAKYTANHDIEYVGRTDDQVKIKGHRIEPGELQQVILGYRSIENCIVLVHKNEQGENELASFVVFKEVHGDQLKEIQKSLLSDVPRYMYPAHLYSVETIPMTSNGKVDKGSLLARCVNNDNNRGKGPHTLIERDLVEVWKSVLKKEVINVDDNFFSLGGDSIRSLKIISEAEKKGYTFTLEDVFEYQTIEELATFLEEGGKQEEAFVRLGSFELISDVDRMKMGDNIEDAYPLVKAQEGMFYHLQLYPKEPLYHNVDSVQLRGVFDYTVFKEAVQITVSQNEMLRTSFNFKKFSVPLQLVHKSADLQVEYEDIRHLSHSEQEDVISQFVEFEKKNTFDLSKAGLIRFYVHQRTDDTFQFSLTECHLIFDGWSLTSTLAEIFNTYFDLLEGKTIGPRKELSVDYRDFVHLEQKAIRSQDHIDFWKTFLNDCESLHIPIYETKKLTNETFKINRKIVELKKEVSQNLKRVSEMHQVPVKSILLASHMKALQVISGQSDVVTGMVTNGRMDQRDGEKVKGLFINTVPFRQQIKQGSWVDLYKQTFTLEQSIMPFRRLPLPEIQRHVNQAPLFETAFNYVYFHSMEPLLKSNKMEFLNFNKQSANDTHFKLMVTFSNHPPDYEIRLTLAYDKGTFTEDQMDVIGDIYKTILSKMTDNPLGLTNESSFLPDKQYEKIVHTWNNTQEEYKDEDLLLHQLIEKQALIDPKKPALIYNGSELTYQQLIREADKVCAYVSDQTTEEPFIGIYMDRSPEMIISLIGVLKAGYGYLPLDPSYPKSRIEHMVEDSNVSSVLTTATRETELVGLVQNCLKIEDVLREKRYPKKLRKPVSEQPAYMIYTSGSTGKPKGVIVPHSGVVNRILWMDQNYEEIENERVLHKTPLSFDYSVFEIFGTLCTGAALVIAEGEKHKDSQYLVDLIRTSGLTTMYFVPTMLGELLKVPEARHCQSIKRVMCSGEPLTNQVKDAFFSLFNAELYNQYGPTEASVEVTSFKCDKTKTEVLIGKPMANTMIYILNDDLEPVGVGVKGNLYIGGKGLSHSYHGKPSLTAEKFLPNPFSTKEGEQMYYTGDLAKFHSDGNIEYVGRNDNQVKLRGLRIELGEVEAVMSDLDFVNEAVVIYIKNEEYPQGILVSYVRLKEEVLSEKEIKSLLKTRLPRFMIPDRVVFMEVFPVNPNGKLDRKALPEPPSPRELIREYTPLVRPVEKELGRAFKEILNIDRVGMDDDFFELGGNSLSAVYLMNQFENVVGQVVPLELIYEKPTIRLLLEEIQERNEWLGRLEILQNNETSLLDSEPFTEQTTLGQSLFYIPELESVFSSPLGLNGIDTALTVGLDYKVIGIQPPPVDNLIHEVNFNSPLTVEVKERVQGVTKGVFHKWIRDIVDGILDIQKKGPYRFAAEGSGSVLALGIVEYLEAGGEEVEFLHLIDSPELDVTKEKVMTSFLMKELDLARIGVSDEVLNELLKQTDNEDEWGVVCDLLKKHHLVATETTPQHLYNLFTFYHINEGIKENLQRLVCTKQVKCNLILTSESETSVKYWSQVTKGKVSQNHCSEAINQ